MLDEIESKLQGKVRYYKSTIHGISHLRAVSLLAGELAPPEFKKAAMIAGFLHDIGRKNDFGGRQHAVDSDLKLAEAERKKPRFRHSYSFYDYTECLNKLN